MADEKKKKYANRKNGKKEQKEGALNSDEDESTVPSKSNKQPEPEIQPKPEALMRPSSTTKTKRKGSTPTFPRTSGRAGVSAEVNSICLAFVKWAYEQGVDKLGALFRDQLIKICPPTKPAPSFEANMDKNRFKDVVCLEETRVKLNPEKPQDGDYIHANFVQFSGHDRRFIATQAPKENTVEDFWRMVIQQDSQIVMNLVSAEEIRKGKCAEYFPTEGAKSYGRYSIIMKKKEEPTNLENVSIYTLEILAEGCSNSNIIRLIHATGWPEDKAFGSPLQVLRLIKHIFIADTLAKGPVVMHCCAGNAKTAVVIIIDYLLFRIFKMMKAPDLTEILTQMREQRASSIQSEEQFVYCIISSVSYVAKSVRSEEITKCAEELEAKFKERYKERN